MNLAPAVNKMLSNCDNIIQQHKQACLRVTSLLACNDILYLGTSAGTILRITQDIGKSTPMVTGKTPFSLIIIMRINCMHHNHHRNPSRTHRSRSFSYIGWYKWIGQWQWWRNVSKHNNNSIGKKLERNCQQFKSHVNYFGRRWLWTVWRFPHERNKHHEWNSWSWRQHKSFITVATNVNHPVNRML